MPVTGRVICDRAIATIIFTLGSQATALAGDVVNDADTASIDTIVVTETRVANTEPANAYATIVTPLRYDSRVDVQSRGLPEGQADIAIRGGLFESTGVKLGAVTILDPQTGHYTASLPVDPRALKSGGLQLGSNNAVSGFNATVATLDYAWQRLQSYREAALGAGSDGLQFVSVALADQFTMASSGTLGVEASYASSQGDGSLANGDHDFERLFIRGQYDNGRAQTNLALAYQDSFYGWPGAYTGFASLPETDHTKSRFVVVNHRIQGTIEHASGQASYLEVGAYYRDLEDDYDFDRRSEEANTPGSFDHRTRSYGLGVQGQRVSHLWNWRFGAQLTGDELVRSTDLSNGRFNSRRYASVSVLPSRRWLLSSGDALTWRLGVSLDHSNRDDTVWLPMTALEWHREEADGYDRWILDYSASSQLPGYTALNSPPAGLFGGNPDLGRERADTVSLSVERQRRHWRLEVSVFARRDSDLVDWTYRSGAPFLRQANAVDMDVLGAEATLSRRWQRLELMAGIAYLDKEADYGAALVDASYYALNYAQQRLNVGLKFQLADRIVIRMDSELRHQISNPLRTTGSDRGDALSLSLQWRPSWLQGLDVMAIVDNATDDRFEPFPGTPPAGRQVSLRLRYRS